LVDSHPNAAGDLNLKEDEELVVAEISNQKVAFLKREIIYHHIIQGKVDQTPYLLTFCGICNAGIVLSPVIDGKQYQFHAVGAYKGQMIFEDTETGSLWDHISGESLHGKLKGKTLPLLGNLQYLRFGELVKSDPKTALYVSNKNKLFSRMMSLFINKFLGKKMPASFLKTMPDKDYLIPEMTMGLWVNIHSQTRFYPLDLIKNRNGFDDAINGEKISIFMDDHTPVAVTSNGDRPFQLFTRYYAYILHYPKGQVYKMD
jgi:hypothetical protein